MLPVSATICSAPAHRSARPAPPPAAPAPRPLAALRPQAPAVCPGPHPGCGCRTPGRPTGEMTLYAQCWSRYRPGARWRRAGRIRANGNAVGLQHVAGVEDQREDLVVAVPALLVPARCAASTAIRSSANTRSVKRRMNGQARCRPRGPGRRAPRAAAGRPLVQVRGSGRCGRCRGRPRRDSSSAACPPPRRPCSAAPGGGHTGLPARRPCHQRRGTARSVPPRTWPRPSSLPQSGHPDRVPAIRVDPGTPKVGGAL